MPAKPLDPAQRAPIMEIDRRVEPALEKVSFSQENKTGCSPAGITRFDRERIFSRDTGVYFKRVTKNIINGKKDTSIKKVTWAA